MNIILLSGGSGKRLWPLSNDIRSKQFIRLFKNDAGEYESMLQRVYRQVTAACKDARIVIATSKLQASAIRNQLGDKVSICTEPCRRDTFPAVMLAAVYMHDVLGINGDECVVVCPVDPYVDNTYYECVHSLEVLVKEGTANLTLMGIEPSYPSDKYGYIIPETINGANGIVESSKARKTNKASKVKEFKEKPDTGTAKAYISQGALWNAGVFASKLGYLVQKAHDVVNFTGYDGLLSRYNSLEKISFDYAVAEKEPSIQVVRYAGEWKDVGTWNMMAEAMAGNTKGNVTLDSTCKNTHVINELDIPVLCMGCKDMVVAASGDGILVSDKERSGYMKPYVEVISGDARYAEKSWGTYKVIDATPGSITVKITLQAGSCMAYHSHGLRDEAWVVVSGNGRAVVDGMEQVVKPGNVVNIPVKCRHKLIADTIMEVIEVQTGTEISRSDKKVFDMEKTIKSINIQPYSSG